MAAPVKCRASAVHEAITCPPTAMTALLTPRRRAFVLLVLLTVVWGTNWPLFALAVREMSVWTFRAVSVPLSGLVLLGIARLRGESVVVPRPAWGVLLAVTGCYLLVWNIATAYAAVLIPSGQAAVLAFTMPLWSALISWAVLGERLSPRLVAALALGAAAVALLVAPNFNVYANAPTGVALGLLAGLGWATGTLIFKVRPVPVPILVLTGWQLLISSIPIIFGAVLLGDGRWFMPSWQSIAVIAYIALVPTCIGNVCWFSIVGLLPANVAGLSAVMVPVVAMISGAIVHAEPLGPLQIVATLASVAALALALMQPTARNPVGRS